MARVTVSSNNLFPGPRGAQGPAGPAGGPEGPQGPQGPQGNLGPQGPQGVQGPAGPTGAGGAQGLKGDTGNTGATGATGAPGINGTNGTNGAGVVVGGTTGQALTKINSTDYNTQWTTIPLTTRTISTTSPLTGGGDLSANRTLAVDAASTSASGVVRLSDSTSTTSSVLASTPTAVKAAYDLAARTAFKPKSGSYFRTPANQTGGSSFTTNLLYFTPIEIGGTITVTRIGTLCGIHTTTGNVRLGIYAADTDGLPGSLVLDAGTVSLTGSGSVFYITISQTLNAGRYWLAGVQQSGSVTIQGYTNTSVFAQGFQIDNAFFNTNPAFPTLSGVTGALPSTASGYNRNAVSTALGVGLGII